MTFRRSAVATREIRLERFRGRIRRRTRQERDMTWLVKCEKVCCNERSRTHDVIHDTAEIVAGDHETDFDG